MCVLAADTRRRSLKAKKDIAQRLAKARGVFSQVAIAALKTNINRSKNSTLSLFGGFNPRINKYEEGRLKRKSRA